MPRLFSLVILGLALLSPPVHASSVPLHPWAVSYAREMSLLRTEVVDSVGAPQPMVFKDGRVLAMLRAGTDYGLRLTNLSPRRVLVVLSVDTLNPVRGTRAYQGQPGMVLEPGQSRVVMKGKPSKSSPEQALIPLDPTRATVSLLTFEEATDFPIQGLGVPAVPFHLDDFRRNEAGELEWVPPSGYPFRKKPGARAEVTHFYYQVGPSQP